MKIERITIEVIDSAGQMMALVYTKKADRWTNNLTPGLSQRELSLLTQVGGLIDEYNEEEEG